MHAEGCPSGATTAPGGVLYRGPLSEAGSALVVASTLVVVGYGPPAIRPYVVVVAGRSDELAARAERQTDEVAVARLEGQSQGWREAAARLRTRRT